MPIYVPGKVTLRQTWQPMDPDAAAYITAVETADGQALEEKVKIAIDNFVLGCKADGIWSAIKASCILAGARTLAGALVPLRNEFDVVNNIQPANPQAFNFVDGDYDRKTGLKGDGSTKYITSNRSNNAELQNSKHLSTLIKTAGTLDGRDMISSGLGVGHSRLTFSTASLTGAVNTTVQFVGSNAPFGFVGASRENGTQYSVRDGSSTFIVSAGSSAPNSSTISVFNRGGTTAYFDGRLAFYSIGESLDLAKLDARVTDLITAFGVAIP